MNAQMRRRLALQIAATKQGLPIKFVGSSGFGVGDFDGVDGLEAL
jgi:hypothetical protein